MRPGGVCHPTDVDGEGADGGARAAVEHTGEALAADDRHLPAVGRAVDGNERVGGSEHEAVRRSAGDRRVGAPVRRS